MAEKDSSPERKKESSGSLYDVEKMDAFLQKHIFTDDSKEDVSLKQKQNKLFGSDSGQEYMRTRSETTDVQTVTENVTSCGSRTQDNNRSIICDSESHRSNSTPDDHRETSSESCENINIERKKVKRMRKRRYHHKHNSKSTSSNSESDVEVIKGSQFKFYVSSPDSSSEDMKVTSILKKTSLVEECYTQYRKAQKKDVKQYSNEQKDEDEDSIKVEPKGSDDSHQDSFLGYDTEDDDDDDIKAFTV